MAKGQLEFTLEDMLQAFRAGQSRWDFDRWIRNAFPARYQRKASATKGRKGRVKPKYTLTEGQKTQGARKGVFDKGAGCPNCWVGDGCCGSLRLGARYSGLEILAGLGRW